MKFSFKQVIIFICISIAFVSTYQFYWLNNLYVSKKNELHINILNAMKTADINEMQMRITQLEENPDREGEITSTVSGTENNIEYKTLIIENDTISTFLQDSLSHSHDTDNNLFLDIELMAVMMMKGLHMGIDNVLSLNFAAYDSLLTVELLSFGINKKHYVELIDVETDSIIVSSSSYDIDVLKDTYTYDYVFNMDDRNAYRLTIENPNSQVIKQMTGILIASGIILILLGWLFYYLINTIWRQKTLEEMKNDFINNMTHEFKTPLSVSYAAIDALLESRKSDDREHRNKYLNIAKERILHLSGLVEQILSMSRENKIELYPEKIVLADMLESIVHQQKQTAAKPIEFEVSILPQDITIWFDRVHFANILNNIIENSIKYSFDSVKIKISAHINKNIVITIEDNGIGINSENIKHIFEKFYRVPTGNKHDVAGYGLGLFYVKETLEKQNCSISAKSDLGKGTVFQLKMEN